MDRIIFFDLRRKSIPIFIESTFLKVTGRMILTNFCSFYKRFWSRGRYNGPVFANKLLSWKEKGFEGLGDASGAGCGQSTVAVMRHTDFTTDPRVATTAVWESGGRKMAPNGAVMCTAITGVPFFWDKDIVHANTLDFCQATHADPRCAVSCLVVTDLVRQILVQVSSAASCESYVLTDQSVQDMLTQAVSTSLQVVTDLDHNAVEELSFHTNVSDLKDLKLDECGKIGYTYKCMGSALWALRTAVAKTKVMPTRDAVEQVLQELVRAGGDAYTNGAVAGALLDVTIGMTLLPWTIFHTAVSWRLGFRNCSLCFSCL